MTILPAEIWLIIFDTVIEKAIIWLEHCDYATYPHIQTFLSSTQFRHQLYDSYFRLRLVCRRFNALLGDRPSQSFVDSTSFPLPPATRALYMNLDALYAPHFQHLLAEPATYGRLVYLDVTCVVFPILYRTNLSEFLAASAGQAFPNVRRLSLRIVKLYWVRRDHEEISFWTRLHRAFPLLVTLVITVDHTHYGCLILSEMVWEVVTFEMMETLYLEGTIEYSGCRFPRLRHASITSTDRFSATQLIENSPRLESLIASPNWPGQRIDARSFSQLKSLGIPDSRLPEVVPFSHHYPLEQLWLLSYASSDGYGQYGPFKRILKKMPGISQIIVDVSPTPGKRRKLCIADFEGMKLDSIGLSVVPFEYDDHILVIRQPDTVKSGILKRVWSQMRG
jgi:hypothetical protein